MKDEWTDRETEGEEDKELFHSKDGARPNRNKGRKAEEVIDTRNMTKNKNHEQLAANEGYESRRHRNDDEELTKEKRQVLKSYTDIVCGGFTDVCELWPCATVNGQNPSSNCSNSWADSCF